MADIDRQALRDFMAEKVMRYPIYEPIYGKSCPYKPPYFARIMRKLVLWLPGTIDGIDWHPDLDSNQLDMLIDKMEEDGWRISTKTFIGDNGQIETVSMLDKDNFWELYT